MSTRKITLTVLALVYAVGASLASWTVIQRTTASTDAIEKILVTYSMKNEGSQALERYTKEHPFLGLFMSSPIRHELDLPSHEEAAHALGSGVAHLLKIVRIEASIAAWWSWYLLNLSFFYVVLVAAVERHFVTRATLFSLAIVSLVCFVIGVLAPAMVIWTAPSIPMATGNMEFVLQHQVRGIAAIIRELLTTGHWVVGGFLLLFSIVTPLTKASLTIFVTACRSHNVNRRIGQFLHSIGKWSMADVFVAGIILSIYALKAQEATKSIPCLGLYYFIGYCMVSMTTTELLTHSGLVTPGEKDAPKKKLGGGMIAGMYALFLCFVAASSLYTYQQYTENIKQKVQASSSPATLNNADLVLPVHK